MMGQATRGISFIAMAAMLALGACSSPKNDANQAAANDMTVTAANDAVPAADLLLPAGETAVAEDESTAPAIEVVQVPTPAPTVSAAEAAPLTEALAAEQLIAAGTGITRIQQADGWAWMRDGQIIRTASADGHRVSYFRPGTTKPYYVQQDQRGYSYDKGRVAHEYDDRGRRQAPTSQHQREAEQVATDATRDHDRAQQVSRTAPHVDRSHDEPVRTDRPTRTSDTSAPTAPDHGQAMPGRGDQRGSGRDRQTPQSDATPTPSPTPTRADRTHGDRPDTQSTKQADGRDGRDAGNQRH
jgi:hypothetical protein